MPTGLNRTDGTQRDGFEHLRQSIADIMTTPKGSRVLARDYGCDLTSLIDAPMNEQLLTDAFASVAQAIHDFEPRFELTEIGCDEASQGTLRIGPLKGFWYFNWPDPGRRFVEITL